MNKAKYYLAFSVLTLCVLFACKKEETPPAPAPKPTNTYKAVIANKPWQADSFSAVVEGNRMVVTGFAEDGRTVTLTIAGLVAKKYELSETSESEITLRDSNFTVIRDYTSRAAGFKASFINVTKLDTGAKIFSCTFEATMFGLDDNKLIAIENGEVYEAPIVITTKRLNKIRNSDFEGVIEGARVVKVGNRDTVRIIGQGEAYRNNDRIVVDYPYQGGIMRFDIDSTLNSGFTSSPTPATPQVRLMYISNGDTLRNADGDFKLLVHDRINNVLEGEIRYVSAPFGSFNVGDYVNTTGEYQFATFRIVYPKKEFTIIQ